MRVPFAKPGEVYDPHWSRKERLFVLGAGFSVEAGLPMTPQVLAKAMQLLAAEQPNTAGTIDDLVKRAFRLEGSPAYERLSMSEVCTLLSYHELTWLRHNVSPWDRGTLTALLALRLAIAKVIAMETPASAPALYRAFAKQLRPRDIVVSFNWDCLLEIAMMEEGVRWSYGNPMKEGQWCVRLLKLHGSINWRRSKRNRAMDTCTWHRMPHDPKDRRGGDIVEEQTDDEDVENDGSIDWTPDLFGAARWEKLKPLGYDSWEFVPLIVMPGYGKAFDVRYLRNLWSLPSAPGGCMATAGDVFVVGLGLARDDFIIQAMFRDTLQHVEPERRVVIINPDSRALDNYAFLVGRPNVRFLCHNFGTEDVELMAHSASTERWKDELPPDRPSVDGSSAPSP